MDISQEVKPLGQRIICFSVPIKRKLAHIDLYMPNERKGHFSTAQRVWILSMGPHCVTPFPKGQEVYVHDGFEIETSGMNLWEKYRDDPAFRVLKDYVDSVDGEVSTDILTEDSIIAIEDGT